MLVSAEEEASVGARRPRRPAAPDITSKSLRGAADPARCYLLFAGVSQSPRGGLGDLVGTFTSEDTARQAFQDIRLNGGTPWSWAQLAVVEGEEIKPLCWFGIGATPARRPVTDDHARAVDASMSPPAPGSLSTTGPKREPAARLGLWNRVVAALVGVLASRRKQHRPPSEDDGKT